MSPLPASPGLGHKSFVGIAKEATLGTAPAAAQIYYELRPGAALDAGLEIIRGDALRSNRMSPGYIGQGIRRHPTLPYSIMLPFEGAEHALRMILPTYSQAVVEGSVRDHTFKEGGALSSYTKDFSFGDMPTGKVTQLTAAYARAWSIRGEADAPLIMEIDTVAYDAVPDTTSMAAGSYPTANLGGTLHEVLATTGNLKDGSGASVDDIVVRSFTLSGTVPHTDKRPRAGNKISLPPVRTGAMTVTLALELEYNSKALMEAVRAFTQTDVKLLVQLATTIGSTSKREFEIAIGSPKPAQFGKAIPDAGVITQTVTYEAEYNASAASAVVIRTRNLAAALS